MSDVYLGNRASTRNLGTTKMHDQPLTNQTNVSLQTPDGQGQEAVIGDISAAIGMDKDLNPNAATARTSGTTVKSPRVEYETACALYRMPGVSVCRLSM